MQAAILDLQAELDNQKWRTTVLEAEKLSKHLDISLLSSKLEKAKELIAINERDNHRLNSELKRLSDE